MAKTGHFYFGLTPLTDIEKLLESLQGKCSFKKMSMPNLAAIAQHPQKSEFLSEWKNMLHQSKRSPTIRVFWGTFA